MSGNHPRENTRGVKGKAPLTPRQSSFMWMLAAIADWLRDLFPVPPRVVKGGVMLRKDVMRNMQIDDETFVAWREAGLKTCQEAGTRNEIILSDRLIEFLDTNPVVTKSPKPRKAS